MALATRCPNCQAMFRVVADQLKLRGGLVRCGSCRHVFDAIGSLSYVEDAAAAPAGDRSSAAAPSGAPSVAPVVAPIPAPSALAPAATPGSRSEAPAAARPVPVAAAARVEITPAPTARAADAPRAKAPVAAPPPEPRDPLAIQTLLATNDEARPDATSPLPQEVEVIAVEAAPAPRDPLTAELPRDAVARTAASESWAGVAAEVATNDAPERTRRGRASEDVAPEPAFLRDERRPRGFSIVFGGGSALLVALMLVQLAVMFRTEIVTRFPQWRPQLATLCDLYGCSVGWPTRPELLAVIGTELQAVPGTDILELTAVVRNRAGFRVALPAVEVTLTDTTNRPLARKVFAPVDYLASSGDSSSRINEGLGPGSDYVVKIAFEARGLSAAGLGFVVYPFYL